VTVTKVRLQPNVPLRMDVRFCDVVRAGDDALEIKFKGRRPEGGDDLLLYLDHDSCVTALTAAGVLADLQPEYSFDSVPDKGIPLSLANTRLAFFLSKTQAAAGPLTRLDITTWSAVQTSAPPSAVSRGPDFLTVMEFVAAVCVPEFERLYGHLPDDTTIARMQQSLFLQHCRDLDDYRRRR
jgi:hypothetical protein